MKQNRSVKKAYGYKRIDRFIGEIRGDCSL